MTESEQLLADGDAAFRRREYEEATNFFKQAAEVAEAQNDGATLVQALCMVARGYLIRELRDDGLPWIERAGNLATAEQPAGWSRYLGVRGRFEWQEDNNATATATFREMYDYCLEHSLHNRAIDAAHMVAITGTQDEQIFWAKKGIVAAEQGEVDGWLGPLWNNLGATYDEAGQYDEALEAYTRARHYHWKVGDEHAKLAADWAVGKTYRRLGQPATAAQWLRPVLAWAERRYAEDPSMERGEWVGLACWDLGEIAASEGREDDALELLRRAERQLGDAKMPEWDANGWQEILDRIDAVQQNE